MSEQRGKLIVIEGLDGSGKATQSEMLASYLVNIGVKTKKITFPDYSEKSSVLAKMYLDGEIGTLDEVNSFAASSFYSVDRYVSYMKKWREDYLSGAIIVSDRYTTSNATHQMAKLPKNKWDEFLTWLTDFEYNKLGIPSPDMVIYLDMQPATTKLLIEKRYSGDNTKKDIHEVAFDYMMLSRQAALYAAEKQNWHIVKCCDGNKPYSVEEISQKIREVYGLLQK